MSLDAAHFADTQDLGDSFVCSHFKCEVVGAVLANATKGGVLYIPVKLQVFTAAAKLAELKENKTVFLVSGSVSVITW